MSDAWKKFTTAMSNKRTGKKTNKPNNGNASILKKGEIVVQRLRSDVQGKAQKCARIGPRKFVPFSHENVTVKNLKEACYKHFKSRINENMVCDILPADQGPSCSLLEQIPNFNVIHVRFVVASNDPCPWEANSSCPSNSTARVTGYKKTPREEATSLPNPKLRFGTFTNKVQCFGNQLSASRLYEMKPIVAIVQSTQNIHLDLFRSDKHVRDMQNCLFQS